MNGTDSFVTDTHSVSSLNARIASLDLRVLMVARRFPGLEIHDRIIVATAAIFQASLITKDAAIRDSGLVECIW